jgi:hypothetical protein
VNQRAFEIVHARPRGQIALIVAIVSLAHPQEIGGETYALSRFQACGIKGPKSFGGRPGRRVDAMAIADVLSEVVLFDHFGHVAEDFLRSRNGFPHPWLEAVAEGVEVAIRTHAGIAVCVCQVPP